jgi:hypothetical protein
MISTVQSRTFPTDAIDESASHLGAAARDDVDRAEQHAGQAIANAAGSAVNAVWAAGDAVAGTAEAALGAGHLAAAGQLGLTGAAEWLGEKAVQVVPHALAPESASPQQGQGVSGPLLSAAKEELHASAQSLRAAWTAWKGTAAHVAGSVINAGLAVDHTLAAASDLAAAGIRAEAAATLKLAADGIRAATAAADVLDGGGTQPEVQPTQKG